MHSKIQHITVYQSVNMETSFPAVCTDHSNYQHTYMNLMNFDRYCHGGSFQRTSHFLPISTHFQNDIHNPPQMYKIYCNHNSFHLHHPCSSIWCHRHIDLVYIRYQPCSKSNHSHNLQNILLVALQCHPVSKFYN